MTADPSLTKESLISQLQQLAGRLGKTSVSRSEFIRETGISESRINRHFHSWNDLVRSAGLAPNEKSRIDDPDLFHAMKDAFLDAGKICPQTKFDKLCRYSLSVYQRRGWGNWIGVLARFREWATINATDFPYMEQLPPAAKQVTGDDSIVQPTFPKSDVAEWTAKGGRQYGSFLNFRGLLHAPMNENGVIFLFGMVALELGYVVESITPGFPDCEAKRRISRSSDTWERARIEFEFESRSFMTHGHNVAKCDVIVCWKDNWPDCPIEVLELQTAIHSLDG